MGESGSGKTTLARLIAGLEVPDGGEMILDGNVVANHSILVPPQRREVGMVFQDYALFPHMTVLENVGYGIAQSTEKKDRIEQVLNLVGLQDFGYRFPHQLSGGQQQRVALARALAPSPKVLLLDEPFSNLDTSLKRQLRAEIFQIIRKSGVTAIFLTHDTQDAMAVSDKIIVLQNGRIIQEGTAKELYESPVNLYNANLFGPIVKFRAEDLTQFSFEGDPSKTYAIRQHNFEVNPAKKTPYTIEVSIEKSTYLGDIYLNQATLSNKKTILFTSSLKCEDQIRLGFSAHSLLVFK